MLEKTRNLIKSLQTLAELNVTADNVAWTIDRFINISHFMHPYSTEVVLDNLKTCQRFAKADIAPTITGFQVYCYVFISYRLMK